MPNWCSTAYAIEGNATELKKLYELMKDLEKRQKPSVQNGFGTTWLGCLVEASEKVGKRYIAVERGITSNSTVRCLHSIQKQRGLPAMKCLIWYVRNIPRCDISISRKNLVCVSIGRMMMRANTFLTDTMLMYALRRKNTIPSIFKTWKAYMTGWRIFAKYKSNPVRMSMRLSSNGKKKMKTHTALFTNIKYRYNRRA